MILLKRINPEFYRARMQGNVAAATDNRRYSGNRPFPYAIDNFGSGVLNRFKLNR